MMLHHIGGIYLTAYALLHGSWKDGHPFEEITMALIYMELTNPVLHISYILHKTGALTGLKKWTLSLLLISLWIKLRIIDILLAANAGVKEIQKNNSLLDSDTLLGVGFVIILIGLQPYWLGRLLGMALKK